jgi:Na+-transporting NADH:ubiquinone oxidoreductase subunit C
MKKSFFSVIYMFVLTLFFTSVVSGVKYFSDERIEMNQRVKLQRLILTVLNIPVDEDTPDEAIAGLFEDRVEEMEGKGRTLYVARSEEGEVEAYAFPVSGAGFWGPIYGMVAIDPSATTILGVAFYRHAETPGLGARITEEWFTRQFKGLPLVPREGDKIFRLLAPGMGRAEHELDAITGATGTSRAVDAFLNEELMLFLQETWPALEKKG